MSELNYSYDNGTFWSPHNHVRVFKNKKYTVLARDKMGNISLPYDVEVNNYFKRDYDYPVIKATRSQEATDQWCAGSIQLSYPQFPSQNLFKFNEIKEGEDAYYKIERLENGNIKVTVKQEWTHSAGIPLFRIDNLWSSNWLSTAFCLENTNMTDTQTSMRWFIPPNGTWSGGIPIQTIVTTGKQWMYQSANAPGWQYMTLTNQTSGIWWEFSSIQVANENGNADWHLALRNPSPEYQPYFIKVFKSENREGPYAWIGQAPSVNGETIFTPQNRDYALYYRLQDSWGNTGPITPVRIRMDNTQPTNLNVSILAKSRMIKATVTANDGLSGIAGYSVSINNGGTWTSIQIGNVFPFYRLPHDTYVVKARAYDKAGNYVESTGQTYTI